MELKLTQRFQLQRPETKFEILPTIPPLWRSVWSRALKGDKDDRHRLRLRGTLVTGYGWQKVPDEAVETEFRSYAMTEVLPRRNV